MSNPNGDPTRNPNNNGSDWTNFQQLPTMPVRPDVQAFQEKIAANMAALRNSAPLLAMALRNERTALQQISGDSDSSPAKMTRLSIEAKTQARDAIEAMMRTWQQVIDQVRAACLAAQNTPINGDATVSELQLATALSFVREAFAHIGGTGYASAYEAIPALVQSGIAGIIQALRTYLPLYAQQKYGGNPALMKTGSAALMKVLDMAASPVEAPLYAAARDVLAELADSEPRLKAGYTMALKEAEGGIWLRSGHGTLPAWQKGQLVKVFDDQSVAPGVVQR